MNRLKDILKSLRQEKGLTQKQIAEELGVSPTGYAGWEQGYRSPDVEQIIALCKYFGVSADYLIGLENEDGSKNY